MSLLALLEQEDSEYISISDLVDEIHKIIGTHEPRDKAVQILLIIMRKENELNTPHIFTKELLGWREIYPRDGKTELLRAIEAESDDLPF